MVPHSEVDRPSQEPGMQEPAWMASGEGLDLTEDPGMLGPPPPFQHQELVTDL